MPGLVTSDSPLAWVNLRGRSLLRWLRAQGRAVQIVDVVDVDWASGTVTAWASRMYTTYVRKCSAYAQVAVLDSEGMRLLTMPRSVVHLKSLRSMNIR